MPAAVRLGDLHMGHGCFPPTPAIQGSSNVMTNGRPAVSTGDAFAPHSCGKKHSVEAGVGSSTVFINGKPATRVGDSTTNGEKTCSALIAIGSFNVIIGG